MTGQSDRTRAQSPAKSGPDEQNATGPGSSDVGPDETGRAGFGGSPAHDQSENTDPAPETASSSRGDTSIRQETRLEQELPAADTKAGAASDGPRRGQARIISRIVAVAPGLGVALAPLCALFLVSGGVVERLAAVVVAFLGGSLAVYLLARDDNERQADAQNALEADRQHLRQRLEAVEDQAWELREATERQASILQALGDVVIRRNMTGTVLYVSPAAQALFRPEAMPQPGQPLHLPLAVVKDAAGPTAGDVAFGDIRLETRHGPRWFSRLDVTVRDGSRDTPLIQTLLRDVTDRRMMEEELLAARNSAETASEAKSRFLATVSHEIRTPLNGILGMAALLRDTRLSPEQAAYADALKTSGETLLLLIDELLDFSRAEAGRLAIHPAPCALEPLCEQVVELLAPRAQAKGLEIALTISPSVPDEVTVDASRLRQILYNLAGNGVKFTEGGGVSIDIVATEVVSGGGELVITVADTGIGFAPEDAARMFGEFEQVDHGPSRRYGGTGLGLAIVQRLVTLMAGSIAAEGEEGIGATFVVRLPIPEVPVRTRVWPEIRDRQIIVVSTGQVEAAALSRHLSAYGASVSRVLPGDPVLMERLAVADLVLLDHGSVNDGAAWLAGARAAGCQVPAIVLITPTERERLDRLRSAGFSAYLIRPVRSQTLVRTLTALLAPSGSTERATDSCVTMDGQAANWGVADAVGTSRAGGGSIARAHSTDRQLAPARPLRLLLAEDNDINRLLGEALLRKLGHETELATNGHEAVAAAERGCFDAILMDLHMPGLDGFGAIAAIRAKEAETGASPVPILVVTADVMPAARERARELGVAGYLTKPLNQTAVAEELVRLGSPS